MPHTIQSKSIQTLISWADSNQLPEETFPRDADKLLSLVKLNLHDQNLTSIPAEISVLKNLQELYLSYNKLSTLPKEIGELTNLKVLWVMGNKLALLPNELHQLPLLKDLMAFSNKIAYISPDVLDMPKLKSLFLHDNCLDMNAVEDDFMEAAEELDYFTVYNQNVQEENLTTGTED